VWSNYLYEGVRTHLEKSLVGLPSEEDREEVSPVEAAAVHAGVPTVVVDREVSEYPVEEILEGRTETEVVLLDVGVAFLEAFLEGLDLDVEERPGGYAEVL